ncbi:MAG: hypothetical protein GY847_11160, partial [Proteobacteria bacterium]|nr:hypothetical protein [Pseudomonadota bacterium]
MTCTGGICAVDCSPEVDMDGGVVDGGALDAGALDGGVLESICSTVDPSLTCADVVGLCVPACDEGECSTGFSCYDTEDACLPDGTFPGAACRSGTTCDDVGGAGQTCIMGVCAIDCETYSDALCEGIDSSLTCADDAAGVCVPACVSGVCPTGLSCYNLYPGYDNACLPDGTFPGSACVDDACYDVDYGAIVASQTCVSGVCTIDCSDPPGGLTGDVLCGNVSSNLMTCYDDDICVVNCGGGGTCIPGYSCYDQGTPPAQENSCLPNGSFPGSACGTGNQCDQLEPAEGIVVDMICVATDPRICAIDCLDDDYCGNYGLTCSEPAGSICVTP